jgi:hypothetical protein
LLKCVDIPSILATFFLLLQDPGPLNTEIIHFLDSSLINRLLPSTPHHILKENCCWKWHCIAWCGFSCAHDWKFLLLVILSQISLASSVNKKMGRIYNWLQPFKKLYIAYLTVEGVVVFEADRDLQGEEHIGNWHSHSNLCDKFSAQTVAAELPLPTFLKYHPSL